MFPDSWTADRVKLGSESIAHDNDVDNLVKQFPGAKKIK